MNKGLIQQMDREYTKVEADRHNKYTQNGWAILDNYIILPDRAQVRIGFFAKRRLKKAVTLFHNALDIAPDNYSSKWALGKIYQVLGDHQRSLKWFEEALELENTNADVCREASLAALDCGEFSKSLDYSEKAIELKPDDPGLYCNKALAMMFLKRDSDAIEIVDYSLKIKPDDQITLNVKKILNSVADGRRSRPETMKDI